MKIENLVFLALGLLCLPISGCVTVDNATTSGVHFGFVKFNKSDAEQQSLQYLQLSSLGLWLDNKDETNSLGLGWKNSSTIVSPPQCQITVIIDDVDEAGQIIKLLSEISNEKDELCIAEI